MPRKNPKAWRALNKKPKADATTKTVCVTHVIPAIGPYDAELGIASDPDEPALEAQVERCYAEKFYILAIIGNADNSRTIVTTKRGVPVDADTESAEPEAEEPAV